jgi:hypothetical protein
MARPKKTAVQPAAVPEPESAAEVRKTRIPLPRPGELHQLIQTAAYFLAEKDGFRMHPGLYWKEAEKEIAARFQ